MAQVFRFRADLRCHLANGETTILRNYRIAVEDTSRAAARASVRSVATEMVHDAGSDLLDAPLDHLDILRLTDD